MTTARESEKPQQEKYKYKKKKELLLNIPEQHEISKEELAKAKAKFAEEVAVEEGKPVGDLILSSPSIQAESLASRTKSGTTLQPIRSEVRPRSSSAPSAREMANVAICKKQKPKPLSASHALTLKSSDPLNIYGEAVIDAAIEAEQQSIEAEQQWEQEKLKYIIHHIANELQFFLSIRLAQKPLAPEEKSKEHSLTILHYAYPIFKAEEVIREIIIENQRACGTPCRDMSSIEKKNCYEEKSNDSALVRSGDPKRTKVKGSTKGTDKIKGATVMLPVCYYSDKPVGGEKLARDLRGYLNEQVDEILLIVPEYSHRDIATMSAAQKAEKDKQFKEIEATEFNKWYQENFKFIPKEKPLDLSCETIHPKIKIVRHTEWMNWQISKDLSAIVDQLLKEDDGRIAAALKEDASEFIKRKCEKAGQKQSGEKSSHSSHASIHRQLSKSALAKIKISAETEMKQEARNSHSVQLPPQKLQPLPSTEASSAQQQPLLAVPTATTATLDEATAATLEYYFARLDKIIGVGGETLPADAERKANVLTQSTVQLVAGMAGVFSSDPTLLPTSTFPGTAPLYTVQSTPSVYSSAGLPSAAMMPPLPLATNINQQQASTTLFYYYYSPVPFQGNAPTTVSQLQLLNSDAYNAAVQYSNGYASYHSCHQQQAARYPIAPPQQPHHSRRHHGSSFSSYSPPLGSTQVPGITKFARPRDAHATSHTVKMVQPSTTSRMSMSLKTAESK